MKTIEYYTGCVVTGSSPVFYQDGQTVQPTILSQWGGVIEVQLDGITYRTHPDEPVRGEGCYTLALAEALEVGGRVVESSEPADCDLYD